MSRHLLLLSPEQLTAFDFDAFIASPFNIVIAGRAARTSTHDRRFRIRCLEAVLLCDHIEIGRGNVSTHVERAVLQGLSRVEYKRSPGRPSKLTQSPRRDLADLIKACPQAARYTSGCWNTPMIQDLIHRRFGVSYHPHYLATLLHNLGFSYQKARFVSDHLNEAQRLEWRRTRWSYMLQHARQRKA